LRHRFTISVLSQYLMSYAPYVKAINDPKKKRNAVILAPNYMTPEIYHGVSGFVGDSFQIATKAQEVDADTTYTATINAREDPVVSGMQIAQLAFRLVDPSLKVTVHTPDGSACKPGDTLITIEGLAPSILSGEQGVRAVREVVKANASHMTAVKIEVDRLDQLQEALEVGGRLSFCWTTWTTTCWDRPLRLLMVGC